MLPLPRYGSIDPTPYLGVFFPMFFGLMLGDAGYGGLVALLALVLHRRSEPGTTLRAVAEVAGPCALFAIIFGVLFGEYFGDLGRRWFGLHPLWLDRESGIVPFLVLTLALGGPRGVRLVPALAGAPGPPRQAVVGALGGDDPAHRGRHSRCGRGSFAPRAHAGRRGTAGGVS
jgi:V/A-type H+-transporting ATPase subunit I